MKIFYGAVLILLIGWNIVLTKKLTDNTETISDTYFTASKSMLLHSKAHYVIKEMLIHMKAHESAIKTLYYAAIDAGILPQVPSNKRPKERSGEQ